MARHHEITSVFNHVLAGKLRKACNRIPSMNLIKQGDFPPGAPIHEDGPSKYDPCKPLVLFAVERKSKRAEREFQRICDEFDAEMP